ncbi:MAG TPA: ATP-binding protein [Solirubrobacteraceae bacterium]|jgi:anti-sigma regulatory factor (Ser/Thr protein kinase)|nr:ATP-binding protein [Solirubrobacteraceae bacterium]
MAVIREQAYDFPVVAVRESLTESHPATPEVIPKLRHAVADYARGLGIDGDQLDGVRLAISEALSNVVLHAYGENEPGYLHLTARVVGNELWVLVADDGRGYNTSPMRPGLGWGLAFITDAADDFTMAERADGGSEARMVFRLPAAGSDHAR